MLQLYYCTKNPPNAVLIMHNINFYSHTHTHTHTHVCVCARFIKLGMCAIKIGHAIIKAALDGC